jgi:hypothetical protein
MEGLSGFPVSSMPLSPEVTVSHWTVLPSSQV